MSFNSLDYLLFFPAVVLIYFLFPKKIRTYWLLAASYYFYMSWNAGYGLLVLFATVITYLCGLGLERAKKLGEEPKRRRCKRAVIIAGLAVIFGMLIYYKYSDFAAGNINVLLAKLGTAGRLRRVDILLPVGISFFTFQAAGYLIDVYRDNIEAEKNPFRYALFISFFPHIAAGPIERAGDFLPQLKDPPGFDTENARSGLLTMAYGLFMKIAVADNIAAVVDPVFNAPDDHSGMTLLFATLLFAVQIYCDFNGYTQIAIGSARVLGFKLRQNFNSPYMGLSVKDFWKRWHISLTSWFRDYLYIPLGGNRKGKIRKHVNTMIVFLCSGLWHGAAWQFVVWGGLNGLFSVVEDAVKPAKKRLCARLSINTDAFMYKAFQRAATFVLISFTWLFFRADDLAAAFHMLEMIAEDFRLAWLFNFGFVDVFGSPYALMTVLIPLIAVIVTDVMNYHGKDVKAAIFRQQTVFRWIIYAVIMLAILYWGLYGADYEQT
ncbi:MAG: MBOAT family protein [Oscillospiraceae bacterium]|nr:MBOAT family protein [Oscillospiraceae bacterium]